MGYRKEFDDISRLARIFAVIKPKISSCDYLRAERIWWAALRLLRARQAEASLRQEKNRLLKQKFRHFPC